MKIYVASSWRNERHQLVVARLRDEGYEVYDFKDPSGAVFHWSEIDLEWQSWKPEIFCRALTHPLAESAFRCDFAALKWAKVVLLLLPADRSACIELGWAAGKGKITMVLLSSAQEPELMYKVADHICVSLDEVIERLEIIEAAKRIIEE